MPVPLAAAAFCITMAACHERKRSVKSDQFINPGECGFFVQDEPHSFTLGAIDMSEFVHSSVAGLPQYDLFLSRLRTTASRSKSQ
jgi:hypothetical protein